MKTLILVALLLAHASSGHTAPKDEWFLILDVWTCSTKSCADNGPPYTDLVTGETFATKKQCLAYGRELYARFTEHDGTTPMLSKIQEINDAAGNTELGGFHPRCVRPAPAAGLTATPAQWKDIRALYNAFGSCGGWATDDPELKDVCDLSSKLQDKLAKQGFCFYGHIEVGRVGRRWTQQEWKQETGSTDPVPKDMRYCHALHEPTS